MIGEKTQILKASSLLNGRHKFQPLCFLIKAHRLALNPT